jgi:hypothetical protein
MKRRLGRRLDRAVETGVLDARSASAVLRTGPRKWGKDLRLSLGWLPTHLLTLWFTLANQQGFGRHRAFKALTH